MYIDVQFNEQEIKIHMDMMEKKGTGILSGSVGFILKDGLIVGMRIDKYYDTREKEKEDIPD